MGRIYPATGFPAGGFHRVIYADPPWEYKDMLIGAGERGAACKYPVMNLDVLRALPMRDVAGPDCSCFLWCTAPLMREAFWVLKSWGFAYKTIAFVWVKTNKDGSYFKGMGHWTRANAEYVLLGTRGRPQRVDKGVPQIIEHPVIRKPHSAKPAVVRDRIVQLMGDEPRIEFFARTIPIDWDGWGLEAKHPT